MSVVRRATLHIVAPSATVKERVQGPFLQALLEAFEAAVHRRVGPRAVLCVRRLVVRVSVTERDLGATSAAREAGEALANGLLDRLDRGDPGVVRFASEPARRAAWLTAITEEETDAWWVATLGADADAAVAWADASPDVAATLEALAADGAAARTIRWMDARILAAIARAVPVGSWPVPAVVAWSERARAAPAPNRAPEAVEFPSDAGIRTDAAATGAPRPGAASTRTPSPRAASEADVSPPGEIARPPGDGRPGTDSFDPAETGVPSQLSERRAGDPRTAPPADDDEPASPPAGEGTAAAAPSPAGRSSEATEDGFEAEDGPIGWVTAAAGVFLLARPALVLSIAEILWEAGLREGHVLAAAASALLGPGFEDDPAPRLLGGEAPAPVAVAAWAVAEVRGRLAAALTDAFGEIDVAPEDVGPVAGPAGWSDIVVATAAALSLAFRAPIADDEPVRRWLVGHGRVIDTGDRLVVVRPMSAVDLVLRRAGLDRDPGFLPWVGRTVVLVYESEEW